MKRSSRRWKKKKQMRWKWQRKRMKKDAQNYLRAFDSRFQKEAFVRSGRDPYTAGGKGAAVDERFVDKNAANDNKSQTASKRRNVKKATVLSKNAAKFNKLKPTAKAMPAGVKRKSMAGTAKPFAKKAGKK